MKTKSLTSYMTNEYEFTESNKRKDGTYEEEAICVDCKRTYTQYRGRGHYYTACSNCRDKAAEERRKNAPWWAGFAQH